MQLTSAGRDAGFGYAVWSFVNRVAAEVRKTHPDRFITCCAYSSYGEPPQGLHFEPNVAVTLCTGGLPNRLWCPSLKRDYVKRIEKWSRKVANIYVWDYWNCPRHEKGTHGAPSIFPHAIQEWFLLDRGRVKGRVIELADKNRFGQAKNGWVDWMFDALNVYVAFRLMWDVDADVERMVDSYCTDLYGPGAPFIQEFYERMEAAFLEPNGAKAMEKRWEWCGCWEDTYPPAFVADMIALLDKAVSATEGQEPAHARAKLTRAGFETFREAAEAWHTQ